MTGKVLWWDHRDGYGIIESDEGVEYYSDISVLIPREFSKTIKRDQRVEFILNEKIKDCRCATDVRPFNEET